MKPEPLIIWGAGGHAKVVAEIARASGKYTVVALLVDEAPTPVTSAGVPPEFAGIPVFTGRDWLETAEARSLAGTVALGVGRAEARLAFADFAESLGWSRAMLIHPSAVVAASAKISDGVVIAAGAIVGPGTTVSRAVILNTGCRVDHDCRIESGAHICPGAVLGGHVEVGALAWVGLGAMVRDRIRIGDGALVGVGSVVVKDVPPGATVFGNPARLRPPAC